MDKATAPPMTMKGWCPVDLSGYIRLHTDKFAREDCKSYSVHFSGAGDADSHLWLQVSDHDCVCARYRLDGWQDEASLSWQGGSTAIRKALQKGGKSLFALPQGGEEQRAPPPGSGVAVTIELDHAFSVHCRGVRVAFGVSEQRLGSKALAVTSDARFLAMADYWEDGDDREYPSVTVFDLGAVLDAFGVAEQRLGAAAAASVSCAKETAAEKPTKAASAKGSTKVAPTADDAAKEAEATAAKAKAKEEAAAAALKARKEAMRSAMRSAVQRRRAAAASWQVREAAAEAKTQ